VVPLQQIEASGGNVFHALKNTDVSFVGFGEAYFSWVSAGAIKAWKCHAHMTMNIVVPVGSVCFVFRCPGPNGSDEFRTEEIGANRYARITVPPGIWFGFKGLQEPQSLVLNIASIPHDPNEVRRLALAEISYEWSNL
jgi:dTDP-4-dehydrorhamnose 3,5-epimerase